MNFFEKLKESRVATIDFWVGSLTIDIRKWYHIKNFTTGKISDFWLTEYEIENRNLEDYEDYVKIPFWRTMFRWSFPFVHRAKTMFMLGSILGIIIGLSLAWIF